MPDSPGRPDPPAVPDGCAIVSSAGAQTRAWLALDSIARLHASSEEAAHPIGHVSEGREDTWWRAARPGRQRVEVRFDPPRHLSRIRVVVVEAELARTQEFSIAWSSHRGETHGVVVRQQFNFSPSGATREVEEYAVDLHDVGCLEITIVPDISAGSAVASLTTLQIA